MKVIKWLEKVQQTNEHINELLAECSKLKALASDVSAKPINGMPFDYTGVVPQKMQDAIVARIDLEKKIDDLIDDYINHKRQVLRALKNLPDFERNILHRHYIDFEPWVQIANAEGYSTTHLWRIRKGAYHILEQALDM